MEQKRSFVSCRPGSVVTRVSALVVLLVLTLKGSGCFVTRLLKFPGMWLGVTWVRIDRCRFTLFVTVLVVCVLVSDLIIRLLTLVVSVVWTLGLCPVGLAKSTWFVL